MSDLIARTLIVVFTIWFAACFVAGVVEVAARSWRRVRELR